MRQRESTSFHVTERLLEPLQRTTRDLLGDPPHQLRCRSRAFSTPQRPSSSRYRPTIFRQVTLLGLHPPGVYSSHKASSNSSLPEYPLDVPPAGCATSVLGRGSLGHALHLLGSVWSYVFDRLQGLCPYESPDIQRNTVSATMDSVPLLGFLPPHGLNPRGCAEPKLHHRHA